MMDRRRLLSMIVGSAAAPAIGAKTAARILGVGIDAIGPMPADVVGTEQAAATGAPQAGVWWGTPAQIAMDSKRRAMWSDESRRYDHFKSWGPAFRRSIIARELQAEELLQRKFERDEDFLARVLQGLL